MRPSRAAVIGLASAAVALGAATSVGARVEPDPFPDFPEPSGPVRGEIPLPAGLPDAVHRWLRGTYGDLVPVVETVVVTGRARMRPFGVWLPGRFRFLHLAGHGYRHYIEATLFGRPVITVNERYLDGRSRVEIPLVGVDEGPEVDQAANLGMWAELAAAAPSVLVTDPRVTWREIDSETAHLDVPFGPSARDSFTVRFDPASGAMRSLEAWRYRSSSDPEKILWIAATEPGPTVGPWGLPAVGTATWADQGDPWARFVTEDIRTDVDLSSALRARGL
jgi:hypothetical protein